MSQLLLAFDVDNVPIGQLSLAKNSIPSGINESFFLNVPIIGTPFHIYYSSTL